MGTINGQEPLKNKPFIPHDLKVTLHDSTLIFPFHETQKKFMFLSNIDQVLNFNVQTAHFFPASPAFPPELVTERLKIALSKVLVAYDYLAGRLKLNPQSGRLEIDCNSAGTGFVTASAQLKLDEIGDLVYPNPAFKQLSMQTLDNLATDDQPLCILQVTSFKCGGFALGISTNHAIFDGLSFKYFLENLASQSYDCHKPLAIIPCNDRLLLAARTPPRVTFPHPELLKLKLPIGEEQNSSSVVFDFPPAEDLDSRIFRLTPDDISRLKDSAKSDDGTKLMKTTSFNVVTAHIWRCKALSFLKQNDNDPEITSTVLFAVNIRQRMNPPLPESYCGNAVLTAYAVATKAELESRSLSRLVELVTQGAARITDEYARSAIDWGEMYKGFPHGEFLVSSWWRLGFAEVEYPWGKPKYSCPVVYHRKDIILLFPDIDGDKSNAVNVLVALPPQEMERFHTLFYDYLN